MKKRFTHQRRMNNRVEIYDSEAHQWISHGAALSLIAASIDAPSFDSLPELRFTPEDHANFNVEAFQGGESGGGGAEGSFEFSSSDSFSSCDCGGGSCD